jgi:hypothetical protein
MTTSSDDGWARPSTVPQHPMFERVPPADEAADLDWVRQRLVELDDRQRGLPATDIAGRHALLEATDGLRTMLRNGFAAELHVVREQWEQRAGRKGDHELDYEAIAGMVRSMMPSQGR